MKRATQPLRDAAILVALILLATSVRVTALPELPIEMPSSRAAETATAAPPAVPTRAAAPDEDVESDATVVNAECRELTTFTVSGETPGDVTVIEIEIDPRIRTALGLCPATESDPRPVPADKA